MPKSVPIYGALLLLCLLSASAVQQTLDKKEYETQSATLRPHHHGEVVEMPVTDRISNSGAALHAALTDPLAQLPAQQVKQLPTLFRQRILHYSCFDRLEED
jgi:hypothetical protein